MNKVNMTISRYFEISDSEMWGGKGEVGYACTNLDLVTSDLGDINIEELVRINIESYSKLCNIPTEKIKIISREAYEENTEDDELYEDLKIKF